MKVIGIYLYYTQDLQHNALNSHLYKIGVNDKPSCECGFNQEVLWHKEKFFLILCPSFVDQIQVVPFCSCRPFSKVQLLLSGCPDLGTQT